MKNIKNKLLILSLFLSGFSGNASAQTCVTPPTCDALGYTMSLSDCGTLEHIRCPFDMTKVYCNKYCANGHKNGDWTVGEIYYNKDGANIGTILSTDGTHGLLVSNLVRIGNFTEAANYCNNLSLGGLNWALPSRAQLENLCGILTKIIGTDNDIWTSDSYGNTSQYYIQCINSNTLWGNGSDIKNNKGYVCVGTF